MKQKTYVIRKLAFFYSDEYYFVERQDGIVDTFNDEQEARQTLAELEVPLLRRLDFGNIEQMVQRGIFQEERAALAQYFQSLSLPAIVAHYEPTGELYIRSQTYLPESLTDEQVMHIREITGVRLYELSVFEGEVVFYGIWLPREQKFLQAEEEEYGTVVYFFNTYEEALDGVRQHRFRLQRDKLVGTIDTLTEQPALFKSFIEENWAVHYDSEAGYVEIGNMFGYAADTGDTLIAFNALLKEPLFEIRAIPLEDAIQFPVWPYELV
jgi:hypothetical protein